MEAYSIIGTTVHATCIAYMDIETKLGFYLLRFPRCDNFVKIQVGLPYASTVDDSNILMHFGGVDRNSLIRILNPNYEDQGICYDEPSIIKTHLIMMMKIFFIELNTNQTILIFLA